LERVPLVVLGQLVGQRVGELVAKRLGQALLECSDLLAQAVALRLVVLGVRPQRSARDARRSGWL
jgi:hypothetical protein